MCILLTVPEARYFPLHYLAPMLTANADGAGFAYFDRALGKARIRKFLTVYGPEGANQDDGPVGAFIDPERLGRFNAARVRKGLVPMMLDDVWYSADEPDVKPYLNWLTGGNLAGKKGKADRYKPKIARPVHFVDQAEIERALDKVPMDAPLMFHARLCTHGDVSLDNVHPFRIPRSRAILGHNGVISGLGGYSHFKDYSSRDEPTDPMSDTRQLVGMLAGMSYGALVKASKLLDHVGGWSKFALMDGASGAMHWIGKPSAEDANGVKYSNTAFMPKVPTLVKEK